jgi:hypothetical protein
MGGGVVIAAAPTPVEESDVAVVMVYDCYVCVLLFIPREREVTVSTTLCDDSPNKDTRYTKTPCCHALFVTPPKNREAKFTLGVRCTTVLVTKKKIKPLGALAAVEKRAGGDTIRTLNRVWQFQISIFTHRRIHAMPRDCLRAF